MIDGLLNNGPALPPQPRSMYSTPPSPSASAVMGSRDRHRARQSSEANNLFFIYTLLSAAGKKFPILLPFAPGASQRQTNISLLYPKCPERSMTYFTP